MYLLPNIANIKMSHILRLSGKLYCPISPTTPDALLHQIYGTCKACQLLRSGFARYSVDRKADILQKSEITKKSGWQERRTLKAQDSRTRYKYYSELLKTLKAPLDQVQVSTGQFAVVTHGQQQERLSKSKIEEDTQGQTYPGSLHMEQCIKPNQSDLQTRTNEELQFNRPRIDSMATPQFPTPKYFVNREPDSILLTNKSLKPSKKSVIDNKPAKLNDKITKKSPGKTKIPKYNELPNSTRKHANRVKTIVNSDNKHDKANLSKGRGKDRASKHKSKSSERSEYRKNITENESTNDQLHVPGSSVIATTIEAKEIESHDMFDLKDEQDVDNEDNLDAAEVDIFRALFHKEETMKDSLPKVTGGKKMSAAKKKRQVKDMKIKQQDTKMWQAAFNIEFKSYIQAYCYIGETKFAIESLNHYRNVNGDRAEVFKVTDVEIYNEILANLAEEGNLSELKRMFRWMTEDGIKANLQTYALCLICVHMAGGDLHVSQSMVGDLTKQGYDVQNILISSNLQSEQQDIVIKVLESVIPGFTPSLPEQLQYDSVLTKALREPSPPDEMVTLNPYAGLLSTDDIVQQTRVQLAREDRMFVHVPLISKRKDAPQSKIEMLVKYREFWKQSLTEGFKKKLMEMRHKRFDLYMYKGVARVVTHEMNMFPFLKLFGAEDYVDILTQEVDYLCAMSSGYSPRTVSLHHELGEKILKKFRVRGKDFDLLLKNYEDYLRKTLDPTLGNINHRNIWNEVKQAMWTENNLDLRELEWSSFIKISIGRILYDVILKSVVVNGKGTKKWIDFKHWNLPVPAFTVVHRSGPKKVEDSTTKQIQPHPLVSSLWMTQRDLVCKTTELPMIVPPLPWVSFIDGGNLLNTDSVVRRPSVKQNHLLKTGAIEPVLDSLNVLGNCAWIVNKPVLNLVTKLFNDGSGDKRLAIVINPKQIPKPVVPKNLKELPTEDKRKFYQDRMHYKKAFAEATSLWYSDLYRLSIANMFRDKIFWLPHNLDFRSRTYPIPSHFNHQGADLTRSLLKFAHGKPLGEAGLDWLKIHLVNLTGLKKRSSLDERLEFANEMMDEILDSADKLLDGQRWWTESDEPLQTLACCIEIADAVRSGDPARFVSHLPVHQDGSCNGLQHYAALGRDEIGAKSVNLYPFDKPSDVYSEVVELIEKKRKHDAEHGDEREKAIAQLLEGYVYRKVIKQTIMTTVYGVTEYGAKIQIAKQLKDLDFPDEHIMSAKKYLARSTFYCLQQMFKSAKLIQDWFDASSNGISRKCNLPVEWMTPLNFPVVQGYHKYTPPKNNRVRITKMWADTLPPNHIKQRNAFSPNYIHSLDSTHMMLTALYCLRAGIHFMSVHDCFWTHACDVAVMNRITREQFVALHNLPILEDLSLFFQRTYCDIPEEEHYSKPAVIEELRNTLQKVPESGDFDLASVLKSTYFFS